MLIKKKKMEIIEKWLLVWKKKGELKFEKIIINCINNLIYILTLILVFLVFTNYIKIWFICLKRRIYWHIGMFFYQKRKC